MARLAGIELNDNHTVDYALTKIKGIGWTLAEKIVKGVKIKPKMRVRDLSAEDLGKITAALDGYTHEGDLVRQVRNNVVRLQTIGSYRGMRHSKGLPARGQRTKSNGRTKRGKRKTVGSFRKEALAKMTK